MTKTMRSRREFLIGGGALLGAALGAGKLLAQAAAPATKPAMTASRPGTATKPAEEIPVSAPEDLMREHGLLRRVLLIYDEIAARLTAGKEFPGDLLADAAEIIHKFVEEYHEWLEETYIFPRFRHTPMEKLAQTLKDQHAAGRKITAQVRDMVGPETFSSAEGRAKLAGLLRDFTRMYRPHAAREDTVIFPVLHWDMTRADFDTIGDKFEHEEQRLFGPEGFEKMIVRVEGLERKLGIEDLAQFTPKA